MINNLTLKASVLSDVRVLTETTAVPVDYLRLSHALINVKALNPQISGSMHIITKGDKFPGKHQIEYLPIIDLSSTNPSCMRTTLEYIIDHHSKLKLPGVPLVGFDQPLWVLSMQVKNALDLNVVPLLGNFHAQMSFLGSIGYVMSQSGFAEALATVYPEEVIKKIMKGKYYERAMRAHMLTSSVLKGMLLEKLDEEDKYILTDAASLFQSFIDENDSPLNFASLKDSPTVAIFMEALDKVKENVSATSRTNKLYLVYLEMFDILLMNIHAERLGDWDMYLLSLKKMLPFFAGTGHRAYAKTVYWFLHEMEDLDDFTKDQMRKGYFVVRRTNKAFAGVSVDLAIEQSIMASLKGNGGLTHGRDFSEQNYLVWVLSRPVVAKLDEKLKEMTNVGVRSAEQSSVKVTSKHQSPARIRQDMDHMDRIRDYFTERCLFESTQEVSMVNIATGMVAPESVSVDKTKEVGGNILRKMEGQNPLKLTIKKADLAKQIPQKFMTEVPSHDYKSGHGSVDPHLFFQRALSLASADSLSISLDDCLEYELCASAQSLFDVNGFMRVGTKSDLAKFLVTESSLVDKEDGDNLRKSGIATVVVDGGAVLHRVAWPKGDSVAAILKLYASHVRTLCGSSNAVVVFDGYLQSTTKDMCHAKRAPIKSLEIKIDDLNKPLLCKKQVFLLNPNNKQRFVDLLAGYLRSNIQNLDVVQSTCDADLLIVEHGIEAVKEKDAIIVADDTDILVIALHLMHGIRSNSAHNIMIYRPSSHTYVDLNKVASDWPRIVIDNILAVHAASGCDTTSSLSGIGKTKLIKGLIKNPEIGNLLSEFRKSDADVDLDRLKMCGLKLVALLYNPKGTTERLRLW